MPRGDVFSAVIAAQRMCERTPTRTLELPEGATSSSSGSAYAMCAHIERANNSIDGARQELIHNMLKKSPLKLKFRRNANAATSRRDCCD
jgi:hypothetical protein